MISPARIPLRLARSLRTILQAVSTLLLLVTLLAWAAGYWHWCRISIWRESMNLSGYRLTESRFDLGAGDVAFEYSHDDIDAPSANALGCPPGVRWDDLWFFSGPSHSVRRGYGPLPSSRLPEYRMWRWEHAGIILGWKQWRDTLAAIWGKRMPGARCNSYCIALPFWMLSLVFAALPAQRLYARLRRRQTQIDAQSLTTKIDTYP
jgi:hypothetical protein